MTPGQLDAIVRLPGDLDTLARGVIATEEAHARVEGALELSMNAA